MLHSVNDVYVIKHSSFTAGKGKLLGKKLKPPAEALHTLYCQDLSCAKIQQKFRQCMSCLPIASLEHETVNSKIISFSVVCLLPHLSLSTPLCVNCFLNIAHT